VSTAECGGVQRSTCPLECWLGDKSAYSASRIAGLARHRHRDQIAVTARARQGSLAQRGRGGGGRQLLRRLKKRNRAALIKEICRGRRPAASSRRLKKRNTGALKKKSGAARRPAAPPAPRSSRKSGVCRAPAPPPPTARSATPRLGRGAGSKEAAACVLNTPTSGRGKTVVCRAFRAPREYSGMQRSTVEYVSLEC